MVYTNLQVEGKLERACFFQKTFLVADTSVEMIFEIFSYFLVMQIWSLQKKSLFGKCTVLISRSQLLNEYNSLIAKNL